ncbi:MAG TPA: ABC transporter ATP-binding protein [Actinomycetota bacterium]|nr:ABC transporter ATP-binding protein [Actinomycetota bacterium]
MLKVEGIHAFYGPIHVLFSIDLEVGDGEIVALLGTNGAGKTTILRVISGVLKPSLGHVTWNDEKIDGMRPAEVVKRGIVQMPGGRGVFPGMSIQENLEMAGFLYGRDRAKRKERIEATLEIFPFLAERRRQIAGTLSGGQQQMVTLAKAFVMDPKLLLIDELSLGLAPKVVEELLDTVRRLNAEGVAVVIVEQHVDLALDVASRAYFLERGEVRFSGPAEDLRGRDDLLRSVFLAGASAAAESKGEAEEALVHSIHEAEKALAGSKPGRRTRRS